VKARLGERTLNWSLTGQELGQAELRIGMRTADGVRFARLGWEIGDLAMLPAPLHG